MNTEEYKRYVANNRTRKIKLPSGFELTFQMPPAKKIIARLLSQKDIDGKEILKETLEDIEKTFPDGLTLDDLEWEDMMYFINKISDFFTVKESQEESENN